MFGYGTSSGFPFFAAGIVSLINWQQRDERLTIFPQKKYT
jgi:hypothetical protein